jgi:hypothetical protein
VEKFLTTAPSNPAMRVGLGAAFTRDAWVQSDLNQTDDALRSLQLAIDELRPLSNLPSGGAEGREWLTEALQERTRILRTVNRNAEADKADAERVALWKDRPARELADLALRQAGRAALIAYGKPQVPEKLTSARNLDLDMAATHLKLAIVQGFTDQSMLRSDFDAAILLERDDIKSLLMDIAFPAWPFDHQR